MLVVVGERCRWPLCDGGCDGGWDLVAFVRDGGSC